MCIYRYAHDKYLASINLTLHCRQIQIDDFPDWLTNSQEEAMPSESCNLGSVKRALVDIRNRLRKNLKDKRCTSSISYWHSITMYFILTLFMSFSTLLATSCCNYLLSGSAAGLPPPKTEREKKLYELRCEMFGWIWMAITQKLPVLFSIAVSWFPQKRW